MAQALHARRSAVIGAGEIPATPRPVGARASAGDVRILVIEDLAAIERDWTAFERVADGTVFQSYAWLSCWQTHIGARMAVRPAIVAGYDAAGQMLFLMPLAVGPAGFGRELTFLGSALCDYNAPLLAPDFSRRIDTAQFLALWSQIMDQLRAHPRLAFDAVRLEKMPAKVGAQDNPLLALSVVEHPSRAYLTHLAGTWDEFYAAKRSANTRRRDRTKRKRLGDHGAVALVEPAADADRLAALDTMMTQKARAFARMGVANLFDVPGYRDFYRALATSARTKDIVHISRLDVGHVPAAVNIGLVYGDCYYHLQASYDDGEVSRFGPGAAHLHELMRGAIERGLGVYDFTIGDETYKRDWSDTELTLYDHFSASGWRGPLVLGPMLAAQKIKYAIKRTPVLWSLFSRVRAFAGALRRR
jgi:CelD/BcsL family acetyltransferase involved in cellulose biosynthesis